MLKTVVAVALGLAVLGGTGVAVFRTVGENTKETFDTLNEAFADAAPANGNASARDAARWIERYVPGASGARCRKRAAGWDYVCTFERQGRRVKMGVVVNATQPVEMSPIVRAARRLPPTDREREP
jgi:hypothetical protein